MLQQLTFAALLACLALVSAAQPQFYLQQLYHSQFYQPLAKVGDVVQQIPTAVSHQSAIIFHSRAPRFSPLLAPTSSPLRSYAHLQVQPLAVKMTPAGAFVNSHAYIYTSPFYRK